MSYCSRDVWQLMVIPCGIGVCIAGVILPVMWCVEEYTGITPKEVMDGCIIPLIQQRCKPAKVDWDETQ